MSSFLHFFHYCMLLQGIIHSSKLLCIQLYLTKAFPPSLQNHKIVFSLPSTLFLLGLVFAVSFLYLHFTGVVHCVYTKSVCYCYLVKLLFHTKSLLVLTIIHLPPCRDTHCAVFITFIFLLLNFFLLIFLVRWYGL